MALEGADAEDPQIPSAPRPPSGPSQEGRGDRTQGRLRLGVRGEGGLPLRGGVRAGTGSARGAPLGNGHLCVKPPPLELVQV